MATTEVKTTYIGASVERKEDARLLRGETRWVDNMTLPGMLWMAVVRSPYAHAKIGNVDLEKALAADGVVAAFSGAQLAEEWAGSLPCAWPVTGDCRIPQHRPLASDKARYAGDGVAVVVAESRALAKDAAELVEVDYEPLPAVTDVGEATSDSAPIVHDEYDENRAYTWTLQNGEIDRLFSEAAVTVKEHYRQQRLIPNAIEPRSVLVQPVLATDEYTMWSATQVPHIARVTLSGTTGIPETKLRVIAPDVGGGFGSKLNVYAEEALCLVLARRLGLPIKWIEERSEAYLATIHGRDVLQEIELAASAEGKITAVRVRLTAAMGAYMQLVSPGIPLLGAWLYAGCYDVEGYDFDVRGRLHEHDPDGRVSRRRPPGGDVCDRAGDGHARHASWRWIPSRSAARTSSPSSPTTDRLRARDRLGRLRRRRSIRRSSSSTTTGSEAEQAERDARGRHQADRHRSLDLRRDVRPRTVADPRRDPLRRRRLGRRDRPLPPDRDGPGPDRHVAARAGARDDLLADRRRPARRPDRDVEVLHGDTAVSRSEWTPTEAAASPSAGSPSGTPREKVIAKARKIAAHQLEVGRGRSRVRGTAGSRSGDRQVDERHGRGPCRLDSPQPAGRLEPGLEERTSTTRPTSAGRAAATSRSSRSTPKRVRSI